VNALLIAKAVRAYYDKDATPEYHNELIAKLSDDEFMVYYEVVSA
jgi:hypothetical protein